MMGSFGQQDKLTKERYKNTLKLWPRLYVDKIITRTMERESVSIS